MTETARVQRIAWYRERAAFHGENAAWSLRFFAYLPEMVAAYAREAAHFAGLVIALETEAHVMLSHGTVLGDPPR